MDSILKDMNINPDDFKNAKPDCTTKGLGIDLESQAAYFKATSESLIDDIFLNIDNTNCITDRPIFGIELMLDSIFLELDHCLGLPDDKRKADKNYTYPKDYLYDLNDRIYARIELVKLIASITIRHVELESVKDNIELTKRNIPV